MLYNTAALLLLFVLIALYMLTILLEHGIDVSCLSMLSEEMIKEIIPKVGDRAKLITNLGEWRKVLELANNRTEYMVSI